MVAFLDRIQNDKSWKEQQEQEEASVTIMFQLSFSLLVNFFSSEEILWMTKEKH